MNDRRGFTMIDFVFLVVVIGLGVSTLYLVRPAWDVYHRDGCYRNQAALDHVLWQTSYERKREVWEVLGAYVVAYPGAQAPQMVILYGPRPTASGAGREVVTVDLSAQAPRPNVVCPMHAGARQAPTIDYWFAFGKWRCLYKLRHSE